MSFPALSIEGQAFAVAAYFCLEGDWAERLEIAVGSGWRTPRPDELTAWVRAGRRGETLASAVCLFALPTDRRTSFWSLLQQEGSGGFTEFAADVARYLAFKQLTPPKGAVFDLVVCPPGGAAELGRASVWAVLNIADAEAFAVVRGVRLRLPPGAGCRVPIGIEVGVWGAAGEEPGWLLVVRGEPV